MTFDPTKPVQTRDGRDAEIIATGLNQYCAIVALITNHKGITTSHQFHEDGSFERFTGPHVSDLVNIGERFYVNVWENTEGKIVCNTHPFNSKEDCVEHVKPSYFYLATGVRLEIPFKP